MGCKIITISREFGSGGRSIGKHLAERLNLDYYAKDRRRVNYKHFTSRDWGMSQNYHLSLDSGFLGIERCVDLIAEIARESGLLLAQK